MKKRLLLLLASLTMVAALTACGGEEPVEDVIVEQGEATDDTEEVPDVEDEEEVLPEGFYRSELTNELISEELKDQRPIAVMVDNEKTALPHYGLTQADVVYELMNSTLNGEITRFMALVKDWDAIEQFGSIRSLRPTNILLANEWNAIICHDGGPFHNDAYLALPATDNISGYFGRVNNGKSREFTEYILTGEIEKYTEKLGIGTTYNEYYEGPHYQFASESDPQELEVTYPDFAKSAVFIDLPFGHNGSELEYNEEDGLYYYSEYGTAHKDPQNDNKQLCFKNVILQRVTYNQLDENGYLIFNCIGEGKATFITNGKRVNVTWKKSSDTEPTRYYDGMGEEIKLNTGKTYVGFVADQRWDELVIE